MKNLLSSLAVVMIFAPNLKGQSYGFATPVSDKKFISFSNVNFTNYEIHSRVSTGSIVGISLLGAGGICAFAGIVLYMEGGGTHSTQAFDNLTLGLLISGGVMAVTGCILVANGRTHEKRPYNRWNVITPKKNEIGLAYNF
jgi:hypothetical protein